MAKERGLEFLETEIKGKTELEMGGNLKKRKKPKRTALSDQRRERAPNRSINQTTLGRLQRKRRNGKKKGKQGYGKKKTARRGVDRIGAEG